MPADLVLVMWSFLIPVGRFFFDEAVVDASQFADAGGSVYVVSHELVLRSP